MVPSISLAKEVCGLCTPVQQRKTQRVHGCGSPALQAAPLGLEPESFFCVVVSGCVFSSKLVNVSLAPPNTDRINSAFLYIFSATHPLPLPNTHTAPANFLLLVTCWWLIGGFHLNYGTEFHFMSCV